MKKLSILILLTSCTSSIKVYAPDTRPAASSITPNRKLSPVATASLNGAHPAVTPELQLFLDIIKENNLDAVKQYITSVDNCNLQDPKTGNTLMHFAVQNGHYEILNFLLNKNANANMLNNDKDTPLHLAVKINSPEMVKRLAIDLPAEGGFFRAPSANVNIQNKNGDTALNLAAFDTNYDIVNILMARTNLDANLANINGNTAIHMSVLNKDKKQEEIIKILDLLQHKATVALKNNDGNNLLSLVTQSQKEDVVNYILNQIKQFPELIVSANNDGNTPLHISAQNGNTNIMNVILAKDPRVRAEILNKINKNGDTALHIAAKNGFEQSVTRLLLAGIKFDLENNQKQTALMLATENNHKEAADRIIQHMKLLGLLNKTESTPVEPTNNFGQLTENNSTQVPSDLQNIKPNSNNTSTSQNTESAQNNTNTMAELLNYYHEHKHQMTIQDLQNLEATLRGLYRASKRGK